MKDKVDLIVENMMTVLVTDLKEKFLNKEKAVILYTGDNYGKTLSIQLEDIQITLDYEELKKIIGDL